MQDVRKALDDKNLDADLDRHAEPLARADDHLGAARRARTSTSRSRAATTSTRAGSRVEAARKYDRIVQHGTQSRSDAAWAEVAAVVKSGKYGKLLVSRGLLLQAAREHRRQADHRRRRRSSTSTSGSARRPSSRTTPTCVHYNWHWFWDFGNGDIGNQGVHQMDIARWVIPGATLPTKVWSLGGRFGYEDQGQTPNTQIAVMDFGDAQLIFEVRGLVGQAQEQDFPVKSRSATSIYTTEGRIAERAVLPQGRRQGRAAGEGRGQGDARAARSATSSPPSAAARSEDLNADVEHRPLLGGPLPPGQHLVPPGREGAVRQQDEDAGRQPRSRRDLENLRENLKGVGVRLDETTYQLGRTLTVDPMNERFVGEGAEAANLLLSRPYRAPFVVPETV